MNNKVRHLTYAGTSTVIELDAGTYRGARGVDFLRAHRTAYQLQIC
jgi:hypothetical protein